MKYFLIIFILPGTFFFSKGQNTIDLSGYWQVKLDSTNEMILAFPDRCTTEGTINLPGSLAENGYGYKTEGSDYGILTPEYKFVGKAWYSRDIVIPDQWKGKDAEIFLERVLWESRVYIDGNEIGLQDGLGTPHRHTITKVSPGKHSLTIRIDNEMIHNIGDKGHSYGEYTQSLWNGIIGKMEIRAYDSVRILSAKTYPEIEDEKLNIRLSSRSHKNVKARVTYEIVSLSTGEIALSGKGKHNLSKGDSELIINVSTLGKLAKWSEFTPEVYILNVFVEAGKYKDSFETEFGFYEIGHDGTKIQINGNPVFLRGNLDCVHFPLTGYASCDIKDWERIFRIYKDYGLNHARFHSWCPPEAAFKAANRIGIYLQAEASIWIDWWMTEDMTLRGRPEMDTKGHPKGLGFNADRDNFVIAEMNRMIDAYGNHPSFTMFCIGNELGNSDFKVMEGWVSDLKAKDSRRLYSVSTARTITSADDYIATHNIQGIGRTRGLNGPKTDWDFEDVYSKMDIPVIAHEIGQWPVYPKWSEIDKYTGVLKARNLEEFRDVAIKNGIVDQDIDFARASGALNQIMYKYETESFFRTLSCAGVQLLSMQDYQGQGEALIGWLDSHWESKDITSASKFREHYNTTVPLLRMKKFIWTSDEVFEGDAQLSHHGPAILNATCSWNILNEKGEIISKGVFNYNSYEIGSLSDLGKISLNLEQFKKAEKLTISIEVSETEFRNQWDIWVYPVVQNEIFSEDIVITNVLDSSILKKLEAGANVLLIANELGTKEKSVIAHYYPLYWSLTFFPGQGKTCIGLLLKDQHPAFYDFPTSYHSDWQWESISNDAKGFVLNDLPETYLPIAQPVDDFHRNNKIGSIFELKLGKGKLLVCGYNLNSEKLVARQLKNSLLEYISSGDFNPGLSVNEIWLKEMFPSLPLAEKVKIENEFDGAILYVKAAVKLEEMNKSVPWTAELDEIIIAKECGYQLKSEGLWRGDKGSAWYGNSMELQIGCPNGILGSLYVQFQDWDNSGRQGLLEFEGRKVKLGRHDGEGQWVKFTVMREDSNDGILILKTSSTAGSNLLITKVVLVKE